MTPSEQKTLRRRSQLLEMKQKGYTDEFIKFAFFANDPTANIDSDLNQYNDLTGQNSANQVQVDGRKFEITSLSDQKAYQEIQSSAKADQEMKDSKLTDLQKYESIISQLDTKINDDAGFTGAVGAGFQKSIPGFLKPGEGEFVPGSSAGDFKAINDQLINSLKVDERGKLKGQGTISDSEAKMLGDAVTALSTNLSEAEYKRQFQIIKGIFASARERIGATPQQTQGTDSGAGMVKLNGQIIPVSEAVKWANANPDDPKSQRVIEKYGSDNKLDQNAPTDPNTVSPGFLSSLSKEIPSLAKKIGDRFGSALEETTADTMSGKAPSLFGRTGLRAAGAVGGSINDVFATFLKAGYESLDEDKKVALKDTALAVAESKIGQQGLEALSQGGEMWASFKAENPERAKDIEDVGNVLTAIPLVGATGKALKTTRELVGQGINKTVEGTANVVEKLVAARGAASVDDILKAQVDEGLRPAVTLSTLSPSARKGASEAIKQGFDEGQIGMIVSMAPEDRSIATKMLKIADEANANPRMLQRPIDLAGETLVKKTALVKQKLAEFGKMVDTEAKALRGISVNASELRQTALQSLESLGIKVSKKGLTFNDSVFKMTPALQNIVNKFYKAMPKDVTDAYQLHIFKKSIDELVEYGAKGEGLKGNAERFLKALRVQADDILDNSFDGYNAANTQYREAKQIQDLALELFGKKSGTGSEIRGGQILRSAFSNNQSRGRVMQLAEMLDGYEKKILGKSSGNALDQALFAEIMEKSGMFQTQAITGFAGQIEKAIGTTRKVAEGIANPVKGVANTIEYGVEKLRNVNPQAKRAALESLLQGILTDKNPVQFDGWLMKVIEKLKNKGGMSIQDISPRGKEARAQLKRLTERLSAAKTEVERKNLKKAIQTLIDGENGK